MIDTLVRGEFFARFAVVVRFARMTAATQDGVLEKRRVRRRGAGNKKGTYILGIG
jgi:hypothetical protein